MSKKYTYRQIYENRLKAINYLMQPSRRKATGELDSGKGRRCCLGHMSFALGVKRTRLVKNGGAYGAEEAGTFAPKETQEMLGMYDDNGYALDWTFLKIPSRPEITAYSLADLNDGYNISPQSIGRYLLSVIMGGAKTPWKKIRIPVAERKH